ncbi:MAG: serine/threonine protein kinase [Chloroflexota bacterium]|nr:serine/threonine protein kinase [Chloroflexota bacterium]MDE3193992.1 serine/threonine protein kinase [Chloroflexota bacterium]
MELAVERVLDQRYRILEPIGMGGSSQVYLARDETLQRDVAVKVLDPQAADDATLRKLFVREAQALAKISHPNVVAVYDVGEVDGLPYIVMEHLPGRSLKQRIDVEGPLAVAEAVRLAAEVASGLAFAHSRGMVHADLKPSNILLDDQDRAKIADFGIARLPQEDATTPQMFATAMYVAPERVEGKQVTPLSDVYGLGLVLYEMLVGKPPFTSSDPRVLLRDHVVRQPVPPSHLRPSLPRELDAVVMKCLAKDPALRYARASDVAKALSSLENIGSALGTTRIGVMNEPLQGIVPHTEESPVVALLQSYGHPIRRTFFAALAALPAFALMMVADFGIVPSLIAAAAVGIVGLAGQLGPAIALAWIVETVCIFLFVPGLAVLFVLMGLWIWLRDVSPEQAATALAMPVLGPLNLGPAILLTSATVHGLMGVVSVAWGAVLTVLFAIAAGKASLGAFVQTGISLGPGSLFDPARAADTKEAFIYLVAPGVGNDRYAPLLQVFDPGTIAGQMRTLLSRVATADLAAIATILAWVVAALVVWTVTRLLRMLFDTLFRGRRWFVAYVFAAAVGVVGGASLLYMLFVTWGPLATSHDQPDPAVLLLSAAVGAVVALGLGVVVSATESPTAEESAVEEPVPVAARRIPVR